MKEENKLKYYGWSLGDRYDGWRVRKADPMFSVAPFVLNTRVDSEVFFEIKLPIDKVEDFIKEILFGLKQIKKLLLLTVSTLLKKS